MSPLEAQLLKSVSKEGWQRIGIRHHHGINFPLLSIRTEKSCGNGEFLDLLPLIDWCSHLQFDIIQLLPLNDSGGDASPYNSLSSCALNAIYLSLESLPHLEEMPDLAQQLSDFKVFNQTPHVCYVELKRKKQGWIQRYIQSVQEKILKEEKYQAFLSENQWLQEYALFRVLLEKFSTSAWEEWPEEFRAPSSSLFSKYASSLQPYFIEQYLLYNQLRFVKEYAYTKGVFLKGDISFGMSPCSADVWAKRSYFCLDPSAGAPPDLLNKEGQHWGYPLYRWETYQEELLGWWKERLKSYEQFFGLVRLDHVLGFFRIWGVPNGALPKEGQFVLRECSQWLPQGKELLTQLASSTKMLFIAEDLGTPLQGLTQVLEELGICSTKLLRWQHDEAWHFFPIDSYPPLSMSILSTHDTETMEEWWKSGTQEAKEYARSKHWEYTQEFSQEKRFEILQESHKSTSLFHVNLLQEYLALFPELIHKTAEEERINQPGVSNPMNWLYRYRPSVEEIVQHQGLFSFMKQLPYFCFLLFLLFSPLQAQKKEQLAELHALFKSLDHTSISQHLAFYELHPETKEGKEALNHAWKLLSGNRLPLDFCAIALPKFEIQNIIALITRQSSDAPVSLSENQLALIEQIAGHLGNRKLKGHCAWTREEVLKLSSEEIDLARGLLLFQFEKTDTAKEEIRQYEASIDLMALQIAARLKKDSSPEEKIQEINHFIFQEMQFRFPPHSVHAKDIDLYTFLPSVLDNRQGVCLGVSILYLSLAQRLELPLEIITPPGHIYVRYRDGEKVINIETTARGIDVPSEAYLGINTRKLHERNLKEVIGFAFMNQASVFLSRQKYKEVVPLYEKAALFLKDDPLLKMFMGFSYLFAGYHAKGTALLREVRTLTFDEAVSPETMPDDYLSGRVDITGLQAVFLPVDETRESILNKQAELKKILKNHPKFRAGHLQLAITWLQLNRQEEARKALETYQKIDQNNATVEYYLAALCLNRFDFNRAWNYLRQTERLSFDRGHHPKVLTALRDALKRNCPETL